MKSKLFWFVCELTSASGLQFCGVVGGLLWCVVAFTCSLCVSPCCMWFSTRVLQQRSRLIRTRVFGPDSVTDSSLRGFSLPSSKSLKVTEMNQKVLQNQSSHKCLTHFCFYWINRPELKKDKPQQAHWSLIFSWPVVTPLTIKAPPLCPPHQFIARSPVNSQVSVIPLPQISS